jgi:hypothetical protein
MIGWIFSTLVTPRFNLTPELEIKGFWISSPLKFIDIAIQGSEELSLTSQLIGYIFYILFGVLSIPRIDLSVRINLFLLITFFLMILLVFAGELYSFLLDMHGHFTGNHFRMGATVFAIGFMIFLMLPKPNTIKQQ